MSIEDDIRAFIASAIPANNNRPGCGCNVRLAAAPRVNALLAQLEGFRPAGRTFERPLKALVLHPTAFQRAQSGGRPLR